MFRLLLPALLLPCLAVAQKYYTYVGAIDQESVLLAWGTVSGRGNTIGRDSKPYGKARVRVGDRTAEAERNWIRIDGLKPDTEYPYEVSLGDQRIGQGKVRTYPERAQKLAFFVMGDFGTGDSGQYRLAEAMWREFSKREKSDNPIRFILTTGDNIYADTLIGLRTGNSGDEDRDWANKFFIPYERLIRQVPFYPTLGNHDGNMTESRGDLSAYLDNFFFPGGKPARYYRFSFGGLAEFFALDTTDNTEVGAPVPFYIPRGEQFQWLKEVLPASRLPWRIPYFHHPPFNAGPRHSGSRIALEHFVELFRSSGVKAVFNGHEHNLQFSERSEATGGILYVVTGAGGELRRGDVRGAMRRNHIAGWAAERHFTLVEIEGPVMRITPLAGNGPVHPVDPDGKPFEVPVTVTLQKAAAGGR